MVVGLSSISRVFRVGSRLNSPRAAIAASKNGSVSFKSRFPSESPSYQAARMNSSSVIGIAEGNSKENELEVPIRLFIT